MFDIKASGSSIDAVRLLKGEPQTYPYVTRSDASNGVARFVSEKNKAFGFDKAGSITVGLDTQTAFLQPHDFVTGQNVQIVSGKHLNEMVAMFLLPILKSQMSVKFNWGGNGATLGRMKKLQLMLPVDENNEPDWAYMEAYARELTRTLIMHELDYLDAHVA